MADMCTTIMNEYKDGVKQVTGFHNTGVIAWSINGFPFSGGSSDTNNTWYVVVAMAPAIETTYARVTIIDPLGVSFGFNMDDIPKKLKKLITHREVELYLEELNYEFCCVAGTIGKFTTPVNLNEVAFSGILHYYKRTKPMVAASEFYNLSTSLDFLMTQLGDLVSAIALKSFVYLFSKYVDPELDVLSVLNN